MCALLEDTNVCCICGKEVHRRIGGVPAYYCADCFERHKNDILANVPWVKCTMNSERQRRKRAAHLLRPAHIGVLPTLMAPTGGGIDAISVASCHGIIGIVAVAAIVAVVVFDAINNITDGGVGIAAIAAIVAGNGHVGAKQVPSRSRWRCRCVYVP